MRSASNISGGFGSSFSSFESMNASPTYTLEKANDNTKTEETLTKKPTLTPSGSGQPNYQNTIKYPMRFLLK